MPAVHGGPARVGWAPIPSKDPLAGDLVDAGQEPGGGIFPPAGELARARR